jgi:FixJ family two-component response regulator
METVQIVDTDPAIRDSLKTLLKSFGLSVKAYSDSDSFLRGVGSASKGCVLVEAEMPGLNGMGLLRELRNNGNTIPVVLLTSNASPDYIACAQNAGAAGVLQKPFIGDELMNQLKALVN